MRLPSVRTIEAGLGVPRATAKLIRHRLEECRQVFPCRVAPTLQAIDHLIDRHGVEYLPSRQDTFHVALGIDYVNQGDPYRATVIFDLARESFLIGCWGDLVERFPRRFGS